MLGLECLGSPYYLLYTGDEENNFFWGGGGEKIQIARMISIWENKGDRKNFDKLFKGGVKYDKLLGAARKIQLAFEEN